MIYKKNLRNRFIRKVTAYTIEILSCAWSSYYGNYYDFLKYSYKAK